MHSPGPFVRRSADFELHINTFCPLLKDILLTARYIIYIYMFTKIATATKNVTTQLFHLVAWVPHIGAKNQQDYSLLYAIHVSSFHLEGMSKPISPLASPQWPLTIFLDISWPYTTLHHTTTQHGHLQCWSDLRLTICLLMVYLKLRCHINCMVGKVFYVKNKVT